MEKYLNDTVKTIQELIRIDSTNQPAEEGMPFGKGAARALQAFLSCAAAMGFETRNYDNYVGEVLFGEGEPFAILAHLDVVPAGSGWTHAPFGGEIENGKLYGRGAMDDKGPAVVCLYALKALKDEGFQPRKTIKLIVGCNEECGWGCIDHYKQCAEMPKVGFTPDADFPVIYAEKGILHVKFYFPVENAPFTALYGGKGVNMVCDEAFAQCDETEGAERYSLRVEDGLLVSRGVSAHGSTPEKGKNALEPLFAYFARTNEDMRRAHEILFEDIFGLKNFADETGRLTMSPDVANYGDGILSVCVDIRYPATLPLQAVLDVLNKTGVRYEEIHHQSALFNPKDSFLIQTLQRVYNEATGERAEPIAIGGGTYARALECGAGFGPQLCGEPVTIHQKDEYISIPHVKFLLNLYRRAVEELTK
jgi:putative dipeptidase